MANKYTHKNAHSLIVRQMKIKTIIGCHYRLCKKDKNLKD